MVDVSELRRRAARAPIATVYWCRLCDGPVNTTDWKCEHCGTPRHHPLHFRSYPKRLLLRASVVALLLSPLLYLPVCLSGYYRSFDPCTWARVQAAERQHASAVPPLGRGACFHLWLDRALAPQGAGDAAPPPRLADPRTAARTRTLSTP
jgi:hypothetical protein